MKLQEAWAPAVGISMGETRQLQMQSTSSSGSEDRQTKDGRGERRKVGRDAVQRRGLPNDFPRRPGRTPVDGLDGPLDPCRLWEVMGGGQETACGQGSPAPMFFVL